MRTTLILTISALSTLGAFAQGTVNFVEIPGDACKVYSPNPDDPTVEQVAVAAIGFGTGTVFNGVPIGGNNTSTGPLGFGNGNNYSAQLYGVAGTTATTFSQLSPLTQYTSTFATKPAGAGLFLGSSPSSDPGIPGATGTTGATVALAAWYNGSGTILSLSAAEAAGVPYGWSPLLPINGPLGNQGTPPAVPPNVEGLLSFSLIDPVPEPGVAALVIVGAIGLLVRRRQ